MKSYLIDTHVLIWSLQNSPKLSNKWKQLLEDEKNVIWVSQVSLFEIAIKQKLGKLPDLKISIEELIKELILVDFQILPIKNDHINAYHAIPLMDDHRDPFDRLLIATAFQEEIPLISADEKFKKYQSQIQIIDNY
jgi:PIN domain nuclease of toxin-antitoxin system